jgi:hypothetical protein
MHPQTENRLLNMLVVVSMLVIGILILLGVLNLQAAPKGPDFGVDPPKHPQDRVVELTKFLPFDGDIAGWYIDGEDEFTLVVKPDFFPGLRGTCDTDDECEERLDDLCEEAGHGGADGGTITDLEGGDKMCSAPCELNGAWAFVICKPGSGLVT